MPQVEGAPETQAQTTEERRVQTSPACSCFRRGESRNHPDIVELNDGKQSYFTWGKIQISKEFYCCTKTHAHTGIPIQRRTRACHIGFARQGKQPTGSSLLMDANTKFASHSLEQAYLQVKEQGPVRCSWHDLSGNKRERTPWAQRDVGLLKLQVRPLIWR